MMSMRDDVESAIKEKKLDRSRIFKVSKIKYANIIRKIEHTFVLDGGDIHWSNMGNGFQQHLSCHYVNFTNQPLWYHHLPNIVPHLEEPVYVLFEDTKNYEPKYWLYEMWIKEFMMLLDELNPNDFYIVSKKYDWLISENHEDVVSFVGDNLKYEVLLNKDNRKGE